MSNCKDCPANMYNAWLEAEDRDAWVAEGLSTIGSEEAKQIFLDTLLAECLCVRCSNYPSLEEQQDMQYWDLLNNTTVWADTISAVKTKYPKP